MKQPRRETMKNLKWVGLLLATGFAMAMVPAAQAAPAPYARAVAETASSHLVTKAVTRAGVAHRSARRTTRRVVRRH
jgi:hypothetical protein